MNSKIQSISKLPTPKARLNWGSSLALPQTSLSSRDCVLIFALT